MNAHVFIYTASLCLSVGGFNPFTFKVIIDMYDLNTIFNFNFLNLFIFNWRKIILQYCVSAIHQHESAIGTHLLPLNLSPTFHPFQT